MSMTKIRRGGVLYVGMATTDGKRVIRRPVVVVQDPEIETRFPNLVVAGVTSQVEKAGPGRLFVAKSSPEGRAMGLKLDSLVTLDNLATIGTWSVLQVIGHCPVMGEVDRELRLILGL